MSDTKDIISGILNVQDRIISKLRYNDNAMVAISGAVNTALRVNGAIICLGSCSNLGFFIDGSNSTINFSWTDPDNVILNESILAEWNQTVLVRKEGSYPTSHLDGTPIASTSKVGQTKNYYRDHSYIETEQGDYYYMLFSETRAGAWNNLTANKFTNGTRFKLATSK